MRVVIKAMSQHESNVAHYLNDRTLTDHPDNYTVPVLDSFPVPGDINGRVFVVMPFLRQFNDPEFHCRKEFAEACRQILKVRTVFISSCLPTPELHDRA